MADLAGTRAPGLQRLVTRIPGFDAACGGGLPLGRPTLLAGSSGSGKTLLGMQFLASGARDLGQPGVLVTFEERPEDMFANVESLGWDLHGLLDAGLLAVVDGAPAAEQLESGPYDFSALAARIRHAVERVRAERLFIDGIDAVFSEFSDASQVRRALSAVMRSLRELPVTTLVSAERAEEHESVARRGVEEFVADAVVILRNELQGESRRRTLEILKLRGGTHRKGQYAFVIDPGAGIELVPLSDIEAERTASVERVSLGPAGMDEMTGGGVFRDSLVLLSGATGTGKSALAMQFAERVARTGERAVYLSFEESPDQIVRNGASFGIDLDASRRAGRLRIVARYPQRMGLEDLLVAIRAELDDFRPRALVCDSLSALEHAGTERVRHEFAVGLASLVKARGIATIVTSAPALLMGGAGATGAELSTLVDAIVMLRYLELDGELRRGVVVLKLRGLPHDRAIREYELTGDGMRVLAPLTGIAGVLAGNARFVDDRFQEPRVV